MEQKMSSEQNVSKKSYQTPQLTVHGSVEQLTETIDQGGDWHKRDRGSCMGFFRRPA
jgi:hypothetical protein